MSYRVPKTLITFNRDTVLRINFIRLSTVSWTFAPRVRCQTHS